MKIMLLEFMKNNLITLCAPYCFFFSLQKTLIKNESEKTKSTFFTEGLAVTNSWQSPGELGVSRIPAKSIFSLASLF
jgi:hypothetical protein